MFISTDMLHYDFAPFNAFTDKMELGIDMFASSMKDWILHQGDRGFFVDLLPDRVQVHFP